MHAEATLRLLWSHLRLLGANEEIVGSFIEARVEFGEIILRILSETVLSVRFPAAMDLCEDIGLLSVGDGLAVARIGDRVVIRRLRMRSRAKTGVD